MDQGIMQTIILAVVAGISCYALSRRLGIPAILFYLLAGIVMGPMGLNLLRVQNLGHGLFILVEIGVAIILLEGGMSLSPRGFMKTPSAIGRLLILTVPLTALGGTLLSRYVLQLSWDLSVVFGTLIVVTGPTVIGPLLRSINLVQRVEVLLHWESIWGDVAGVVLSALALKFVTVSGLPEISLVARSLFFSFFTGTIVGLGGGIVLNSLVFPWLKNIHERQLMGIITLAGALAIFFGSQELVSSSGPLAVAVAGFYLSHRRDPFLNSIRHFKDQLSIIFISTLFILLSGFINPFQVRDHWPAILTVALGLGVVVRPLAVFLALTGSTPSWKERAYISAIGPRGILALAAAFYASLVVSGREQEMALLLITTFSVIFISGAFTTIMGRPLARLFGVLQSEAKSGILMIGANKFSLELAEHVRKYVPLAFADTSQRRCRLFQDNNLTSLCVDVLDDEVYGDAREEGFDRLIALTPDDSLNNLICQKAGLHFGEDRVFVVHGQPGEQDIVATPPFEVNYAFAWDFCLAEAIQALDGGSARFEERSLDDSVPETVIPLFRVPKSGGLEPVRAGQTSRGKHLCLVFDNIP
jgi:NhaP-type Na+/H+ or K+/H+ antiporter